MTAGPRVVVFDLDETLTHYDTFLPFLRGYLRRHPRRALGLLGLPLRLLAFWRWGRRTWVKCNVLLAFVGGEPRARLQTWAKEFVDHLLQTAMRPASLQRLRAHQAAGDRVILATASFDIYVQPLAQRLGIDEVLASCVAWDARDRLAGIQGENCRDREKLARLKDLLGADFPAARVIAYSDSHADLPLLAWAGQGVAVSPTPRLAQRAEALGLRIEQW